MLVMPKGLGPIVEPQLSQPQHDVEVVGGVLLCAQRCGPWWLVLFVSPIMRRVNTRLHQSLFTVT